MGKKKNHKQIVHKKRASGSDEGRPQADFQDDDDQINDESELANLSEEYSCMNETIQNESSAHPDKASETPNFSRDIQQKQQQQQPASPKKRTEENKAEEIKEEEVSITHSSSSSSKKKKTREIERPI